MAMSRRKVLGVAGAVAAGAIVLPRLSAAAVTPRARTSAAVDPRTGTSAAVDPGGRLSAAVAPRATAGRVYVGTYTSEGGGGIGVATADPATGALVGIRYVTGVQDPSWLAVSPDARTLFAVSELPGGLVNALSLDAAGQPTLLAARPTGAGPAHLAVHPGGKFLFSSLYGAGSVVVHPVAADGTVGAATDTRHDTPDPGQPQPHAHQVVVDPTGRWILTVDLGLDSVYGYELDTGTGRLSPLSRVRFATGAGPRHLVFHPDGQHVYVADELNSTVTVCGWQAGTLTPGTVLSTRLTASPVANFPGEIAVSGDGRFVYVSNRGDNTVAVFSASADGSRLTLLATPSCGGDWPRHLAIDPTGRWLYVANQRSGDVVWFELSAATGLPLRQAGRLAVPGAAQVLLT
ncbi:MAG: 6-phosphogluconolactonase [Micromonosporaceae bacterium]|nr:6-phosphogluconolactonase [Micromonosporaceae bacterium]